MGQQAARGQGLIPAHAGKTTSSSAWTPPTWGSSPLTRGKLQTHLARTANRGLIPAHAGKTETTPTTGPAAWAHPRSRGENAYPARWRAWPGGSSPLTRGKLAISLAADYKLGLIPAHAGKTHREGSDERNERAHPRSRGENEGPAARLGGGAGSSPLTRGKRLGRRALLLLLGLIPAHAGKTAHLSYRLKPHGAHPRSRGEN